MAESLHTFLRVEMVLDNFEVQKCTSFFIVKIVKTILDFFDIFYGGFYTSIVSNQLEVYCVSDANWNASTFILEYTKIAD